MGYRGFKGLLGEYKKLHGFKEGYNGLQGVSGGYKRL